MSPLILWWWWMVVGVSLAADTSVTTYRRDDTSLTCMPGQPLTVTKLSLLFCAALCHSKRSEVYTYTDGVCSLGKMQLGASPPPGPRSHSYHRVKLGTGLIEMAHGKPAQATPFWTEPINLGAWLAVDGNKDTTSYYHSHPSFQYRSWWMVDLESFFVIKQVVILPRGRGDHWQHFQNIKVFVGWELPTTAGDFSSWNLVGTYNGPIPNGSVTFSHQGVCGRYVSIQEFKNDTSYLILTEVEVMVAEEVQ